MLGYSLKVLVDYYKEAPKNKREWLLTSSGSKEAAAYLFEDNNSLNYKVFTDFRMTVSTYLKYYTRFFNKKQDVFGLLPGHFQEMPGVYHVKKEELKNLEEGILKDGNIIYYILWSPQTHDKQNDPLGWWRTFFNTFQEVHPGEKPVKEICYSDGSTAIEIFKISPH